MQDIVEKVDAAKALFASNQEPSDDQARALLIGPALDFIGELVANSRRIAVALEAIAENTEPVQLSNATAELVSGPSIADQVATVDWSHIGFTMGQGFANGDRSAR
jgi:hypothetical protein